MCGTVPTARVVDLEVVTQAGDVRKLDVIVALEASEIQTTPIIYSIRNRYALSITILGCGSCFFLSAMWPAISFLRGGCETLDTTTPPRVE